MVKYLQDLSLGFHALADPTRRAILEDLTEGAANVSSLAEHHEMTLPALLKHVRVLENAGLVKTEKLGRQRMCEMQPQALEDVGAWITHCRDRWNRRFDSLAEYLEENKK